MPTKLCFPFSAIIGQQRLKSALLLIAIDAKIGGLLISGPRGSAKSTVVRSLAWLNQEQPFVTVPLAASEEMVIGSLDLEKALGDSKVAFKPGLLARAHDGILYLDEVNLLADNLVDLLLDSAASGTNLIERDGISHEHRAEFSLVGTMNPDEGDLRPQLLDRFGLMADIDQNFSIQQRRQIVEMRLDYDRNPEKFIKSHQAQLEDLRSKLAWAKDNLDAVVLDDSISEQIAQRCAQANVEGFRADITMHRASCANAALNQRLKVQLSDLDDIEELVLAHRRQPSPPPSTPSPPKSHESSRPQSPASASGSSIQGSWGKMETVSTDTEAMRLIFDPNTTITNQHVATRQVTSYGNRKGKSLSKRFWNRISAGPRKIDWYRSLARSRLQACVDSAGLFKFYYRYALPRALTLKLVLLDTSASTLSGQGLNQAKAVLKGLSRQAYWQRQQLCVVSFGNDSVNTLLHPQRAPKNIQQKLDGIRAGGGTPILKALDYTLQLINKQAHKHLECHVYLITDGRLDTSVINHRLLTNYPINLVDIESSRIKLGLGKQFADAISARYLPVCSLPLAP